MLLQTVLLNGSFCFPWAALRSRRECGIVPIDKMTYPCQMGTWLLCSWECGQLALNHMARVFCPRSQVNLSLIHAIGVFVV